MNKQTAVERFFSELQRMQYFIGNDMLQAYEEAKAAEYEQLKEMYVEGSFAQLSFFNGQQAYKSFEEYYNETYKGGSNE